jgi:Fe2+ transport system protein FeoA
LLALHGILLGVSNYMTLSDAKNKINYTISSVDLTPLDDTSVSRLLHFGFIEGESIKLVTKVPIFKEPLLVEIRGSQIALTKREANLIKIRNN